ncbi:MAG: flagellar assembly protein FliW [Treponema sp.]|nr:flagellar assembly protein FliW [Treponema sp.]
MDVKTKQGKTVSVEEKDIYSFPEGLFGFENYKDYAVIESEYQPFMWMQSLQEEKLAFLIVDPFLVCNEYELDIDDKQLAKINVNDPADVVVMSIVTIPAGGSPVTANLQGPLVFNKSSHKALQAIINNNKWTTKFDIVNSLKAKEGTC